MVIYGVIKFFKTNNTKLFISNPFASIKSLVWNAILFFVIGYALQAGCNAGCNGLSNSLKNAIEITEPPKWDKSECECVDIFNDYDGHQSGWIDKNFCINKYISPDNATEDNKYVSDINCIIAYSSIVTYSCITA